VVVNDVTPRTPLVLERLREAAGPRWQVRLHASAESTNALAAADPEPWLLVVADHQTAGRGRLGRTWVTPEGAALTFSAVIDPEVDDEWWPLLPLVAGYAVARAVDGRLKWPNDVLLGDEKVCGILVERVHAQGRPLAVVGIGINVDQTRDELPVPTATSLALATGPRDRTELLEAVLYQLRVWKALLGQTPAGFVTQYRELCATIGQEVRVELPGDEVLQGHAVDVDDHGRLIVETGDGITTVAAGDVVHVRPQG
jgi:BirA family biotin operon repressor/biotin-[acetyl-CoA-carboxylase] ligase